MRLLIAVTLLAGIFLPASAAFAAGSGGVGIRLVDVPADSYDDPLARSYIVDRLAPGANSRRRIEITNSTRSPAAIAVYPAAAELRRGRFAFAAGRTRNELSTWTSVDRDAVSLPPGGKVIRTLTISVPEKASPGERHAVIWAEVSAPAAVGGVTLVNRVGVRMYISVGPGDALPASFALGSVSAERSEDGTPLVVAIVHNTGGRTLDIGGDLILSGGPGGLRAGPFPVTLEAALTPGDSESAIVRLDKRLPRGPWEATIRLHSGSVHRSSAATITFPAQSGAAVQPPAEATESSPPIEAIVGILALLALIVVALLNRRTPRGRGGGTRPAAPVCD